jgi:hypothetical protein
MLSPLVKDKKIRIHKNNLSKYELITDTWIHKQKRLDSIENCLKYYSKPPHKTWYYVFFRNELKEQNKDSITLHQVQNDFPGLYDNYSRYEWNTPAGMPVTDAQHQMMSAHYIGTMADILQEFDNNTLSRQIYEDLSWLGLRNQNVAYDKLSPSERGRISNIITNYLKNGSKICN